MRRVVGAQDGPARVPFAHDAVVAMDRSADERAPGAAITFTLCGSLSHDPPCPLAAHFTGAERSGDDVCLRILFATRPEDEEQVRGLIHEALAAGGGPNDHGEPVTWLLRSDSRSPVRPDERDHAERLTRS
jgi:hypothetical protein